MIWSILGAGSGLFPPLLGEEVLDVVSRAKAAIGIFGTQGREAHRASDLIGRIDTAGHGSLRYEDDVLMYGSRPQQRRAHW